MVGVWHFAPFCGTTGATPPVWTPPTQTGWCHMQSSVSSERLVALLFPPAQPPYHKQLRLTLRQAIGWGRSHAFSCFSLTLGGHRLFVVWFFLCPVWVWRAWDNWSHAPVWKSPTRGCGYHTGLPGWAWTTPLVPTLRARRHPQCWGAEQIGVSPVTTHSCTHTWLSRGSARRLYKHTWLPFGTCTPRQALVHQRENTGIRCTTSYETSGGHREQHLDEQGSQSHQTLWERFRWQCSRGIGVSPPVDCLLSGFFYFLVSGSLRQKIRDKRHRCCSGNWFTHSLQIAHPQSKIRPVQ